VTLVRALRIPALRILFALVLLNAQQAALAHQVWHLGKQATLPAQSQLCDYHQALGAVAGAVDCAIALPAGDALPEPSHRSLDHPAATAPGLAPSSRGPPTLP
jgi:hypothetical protein